VKSLVIASLIVIFVVGGIAMFLTIPNQVDFQKSAESAVCVPPEIAEKLNEDRSYAMTLKDFDFITVAECVAKNLVINNLDEKYSIVGEVTSVFVVVAESLPPHVSVAVILSLKDNTNLSSDNIMQYKILVGVSQVNMVNLNSIKN